jgi:threonine dehydrogenase-like Zn-dependent dehydrogenase
VPDPVIADPADAIVRVLLAAICGTDLRGYQSAEPIPAGPRAGHEFLGVVEDVGSAVATLRRGDLVLAPFMWADGTCPPCRADLSSSCPQGGMWGGVSDGGQGEAVRVPHADATLVKLPVAEDDERLPALLALADVMVSGLHATRSARILPGQAVAVIGDGAVGLCAVLAAREAGAERILLLGHHPARLELGTRFGATEIITESGLDAAARADAVLECTGTQRALEIALEVVADGGSIAMMGAPRAAIHDTAPIFLRNLTLTGGLAPARSLIPVLLPDVLSGRLDPSPLFDLSVRLDDIAAGYRAMASRSALKVLVKP